MAARLRPHAEALRSIVGLGMLDVPAVSATSETRARFAFGFLSSLCTSPSRPSLPACRAAQLRESASDMDMLEGGLGVSNPRGAGGGLLVAASRRAPAAGGGALYTSSPNASSHPSASSWPVIPLLTRTEMLPLLLSEEVSRFLWDSWCKLLDGAWSAASTPLGTGSMVGATST